MITTLLILVGLLLVFLALHFLVVVTESRVLNLIQDRANIIVGYPFLILLDCGIVFYTPETWMDQRRRSDDFAVSLWTRNAKPKVDNNESEAA